MQMGPSAQRSSPLSPSPSIRHLLLLANPRVDLASLRLCYKEQQKSPLAHQPWDAICLHLKFVLGGCVPSPWEDFQSLRKVLAIGICDLPSSPDLDSVSADFVDATRSYPSAPTSPSPPKLVLAVQPLLAEVVVACRPRVSQG